MKIIHYIFGIPPLRGGGTIRYAIDLAREQVRQGNEAFLIYPGEIRKKSTEVKIEKNKGIRGVPVFEILNPLPVSLVTGIKSPLRFLQSSDKNVYLSFFKKEKIEILHVHSLMGLHVEMLEAAKELNIKIFFSTHDYFGICPKTNLIYKSHLCKDIEWKNCAECCKNAEDVDVLIKRQTHLFQLLIKFKFLVEFKRRLLKNRMPEKLEDVSNKNPNLLRDYQKLKAYYEKELDFVDMFLFNSSIAKEQYEMRIGIENYKIVGNMHAGIRDNRKIRNYDNHTIRFAYLGYPVVFKGYPILISAMDKLEKNYSGKFVLNTYMAHSDPNKEILERRYIQDHVPYAYKDAGKVYNEMDVLLVPSIWAETYGFVVLEALSYGVPVIITENVGAKDLLLENNEFGKIVPANEEALYNALELVLCDKNELARYNRNICDSNMDFSYERYVEKILKVYIDS